MTRWGQDDPLLLVAAAVIFLTVFIGIPLYLELTSPTPDRGVECRDSGGSVVLDEWGRYSGCIVP